jgi:hypothetical protein
MQRYWGEKVVFLPGEKTTGLLGRKKKFVQSLQRIRAETGRTEPRDNETAVEPRDIDEWNVKRFDDILLKLHSRKHFDMVWVEYVFLSRILDRFDANVTKVIDTHDVFSERYDMFLTNRVAPEWFYTSSEMEKRGLSRAEYVVAIKEKDAVTFKQMGLSNVRTIGHFFPIQEVLPGHPKEIDVLFIGSDNISNVKAWEYFSETMLTPLMSHIPEISIGIAGRICSRIPDNPVYKKMGLISDLSTLYPSVRIAVNPITFGTGLKIKTIEPLAFGCPVVTTPVGIEGMEEAVNKGALVGETSEEFVRHMISLLNEPVYYEEQRSLGYRYFTQQQARNERCLRELLTEVKGRHI